MHKLGMIVVLAATGCSVEIEVPSVAFTSPAAGSTFTRDQLGASGALVANLDVAVDMQGDIARVAIVGGDVAFGDVDDAGVLVAPVPTTGTTTLTALAYDDAGAVLATAAVDVTIVQPEVDGCHAWLDLYKLDYSTGPTNLGIDDSDHGEASAQRRRVSL
jgi:hypothetical protein